MFSPGDPTLCLKGRRMRVRSGKSAEAIVAARRRAERGGEPNTMTLGSARHQKPEESGRTGRMGGEAAQESVCDETRLARSGEGGSGRAKLLEQTLGSQHGRGMKTCQSQQRQCWGGWTNDPSHCGTPQVGMAPDMLRFIRRGQLMGGLAPPRSRRPPMLGAQKAAPKGGVVRRKHC
ncbi:hypothetical protein SIID45300_01266 [Candidatus Magnetaquicoccaceae bacterium FCR-1]|uniref:Uncharacterized protein n=1 Tax=Candidatus Magnetaquiglobus chichijimensis TaxID=3141448 RepID=A0ABQ0C7T9_9PROT